MPAVIVPTARRSQPAESRGDNRSPDSLEASMQPESADHHVIRDVRLASEPWDSGTLGQFEFQVNVGPSEARSALRLIADSYEAGREALKKYEQQSGHEAYIGYATPCGSNGETS